ncbi:hypothetical protein V8C86DRAFT_70688 [Haematococcus lacustris]
MSSALFKPRQRAARQQIWRPNQPQVTRLCVLGLLGCLVVTAFAARSVPEPRMDGRAKDTADFDASGFEESPTPAAPQPRWYTNIPIEQQQQLLVMQQREAQAPAEAWAWPASVGVMQAFPGGDTGLAAPQGAAAIPLPAGQAALVNELTAPLAALRPDPSSSKPALGRRLLQGSGQGVAAAAASQPGVLLVPSQGQATGLGRPGSLLGNLMANYQAAMAGNMGGYEQGVVPTDNTALAAAQALAVGQEGGISIITSNPIAISNPSTTVGGSFSWGRKQL